jgi:hypothetical protein
VPGGTSDAGADGGTSLVPDTSIDQAPNESAPADSGESATTTAAEPLARDPLTGLERPSSSVLDRPAMVVKIDGYPRAQPQVALESADIVLEEIVEGVTRFFAVFHSEIPPIVGPVRSARTQDMLLAPMFRVPLFVWSGGNAKVSAVVRNGAIVNFSATNQGRQRGVWFRSDRRRSPHNLMARAARVFELAADHAERPEPVFSYRAAGDAVGGRVVSGVRVSMSRTRVQWLWNRRVRRWERTSDGVPHVADSGARIAAENVLVLEVDYLPSPADPNSPEAQTLGSGKVLLFTAGNLIVGTWEREAVEDPWTLRDRAGSPLLLTPGKTWVALARPERTAIIDVGVEPDDVDFVATG